MRKKLTDEQVLNIRQYLTAHKWHGAKKLMAKKYAVGHSTITRIIQGKLYKSVID